MKRKKGRLGIEMSYVREVIRLHYQQGKNRYQIAQSLGISHATVTRILASTGERWRELLESGDAELHAFIYPTRPGPKAIATKVPINLEHVTKELGRKHMTRALLYREYADAHPGADVFSYSNFCAQLRQYQHNHAVTMLLSHPPGEVCFLDYAGATVPIYNPATGEVDFSAAILVATLAYSGYTYAEAERNQSEECFVTGIANALGFFGGVMTSLVPDNLKAGVITHTSSTLKLSRSLVELASHYELYVDPARVRKPRDKAKNEERVKAVQNWVLAPLRDTRFVSLGELNGRILDGVRALNDRPFTKIKGSRSSRFVTERGYLRPLPEIPFRYGRWLSLKVPSNYHLMIGEVSYSVPYLLVGKTVEVRISEGLIEIFHKGQRIGAHQRSYTEGEVVTEETHRHPRHAAYLESLSTETLITRLLAMGEAVAALVNLVDDEATTIESKHRRLSRLIGLANTHGPAELEAAVAWALHHNLTSVSSLISILASKVYLYGDQPGEPIAPEHANLRSPSEFFGR